MNKGTLATIILLLVAVVQCGNAQVQNQRPAAQAAENEKSAQIYQLPFASSGNTIELAVANTATVPLSGVKVEAADIPSWLKFTTTEQQLALIKPQQELTASFSFVVDKAAPVQKSHTLKFVISSPSGESWTKEITVAVAAPERFELYQNYPNPFNPTTVISFQLIAISRVDLKIYNMLGQEVASLVDEDRAAGYHQETWNAAGYASGVYVYQLIATDEKGQKQIARKRMLLLK